MVTEIARDTEIAGVKVREVAATTAPAGGERLAQVRAGVAGMGLACALALTVAGCSPESARFGEGSGSYGNGSHGTRGGYAPYPSEASSYSPPPRPPAPASSSYPPSTAPSYPPPRTGYAPSSTPYASSFQSEPLEEPAPAPLYGSPPSTYGSAPSSNGGGSYGGGSYGSPSASYAPPARVPPAQAPKPYGTTTPPAAAMQYEPVDEPRHRDTAPQHFEPPPPPSRFSALPTGNATTAYATAPRMPAPPVAAVPVAPAPPVAAPHVPAAPVVAAPSAPAAPEPPPKPVAPAREAAAAPPLVSTSGQTLLPVPPVHTVTHGDTLSRVAQRFGVSSREIAVANGLGTDAPLRVGSKLTIPLKTPVAPATARKTPESQSHPAETHPAEPPPVRPASTGPALAANVQVVTPVETAGFRWPVRGRIVNNFGARVNGSTNDGIDLAVPEGTPVRAADDGVVAYASNELKGYGNLVLVRHPNGFVTAYANGSEFLVKRNDQVHKGQVIMKSGQTGSVSRPQLHFEIRKNSAPVDPTQYLPSDKSASAPL